MTTNSNRFAATSVSNPVSERQTWLIWQRLIKYFVSAGLGIIGGGVGVVLGMACIIGIQLFYITEQMFVPNLPTIAVMTTLMGLGASWLLYVIVRKISPFNILRNLNQDGLQVIFVVSVLTSLLETFLFMQNMFAGVSTQIQYIWV
ncbi:MAG: hypothetical protein KDI02_11965 [Anaerolineae bacterium]|nr:hypothetical protein [Anaerolineae bacterium]MCB0180163.1 hypothetical protein [Anaerolineae bacterium]MCB0224401.1 hypothetical protein [Anaerolineae bacterium]